MVTVQGLFQPMQCGRYRLLEEVEQQADVDGWVENAEQPTRTEPNLVSLKYLTRQLDLG